MPVVTGLGVQPAERVLVGLCHDLNDRLAVLHGLLHLAARDGSVSQSAAATLAAELDRMELLVGRARQLGREPDAFVEALIVPELLDEALALLTHHADRLHHDVAVAAPAYLPPVRGDRSALRALLLAAAAELPDEPGATVTCVHDGDDVVLAFPLRAAADGVPPTVAALAAPLAVRAGAQAESGLELRLRSLLADG